METNKPKPTSRERSRSAAMRARMRGEKRLNVTIDREAAIALAFLRRWTGKQMKTIIEELLLAERERVMRL